MRFTEGKRQWVLSIAAFLSLICFFSSFLLFAYALHIKVTVDARMALIETYNSDVLPGIFVAVGVINLIQNISAIYLFLKVKNPDAREHTLKYMLAVLIGGIILVIFEVISAIVSFVHIGILDDEFKAGIKKAMEEYAQGQELKQEIDAVQMDYECCGDRDYTNWFQYSWLSTDLIRVVPGSLKKYTQDGDNYFADDVPFSCCDVRSPRPCIHHHVHDDTLHFSYHYAQETTLYTKGCRHVLMDIYGVILLTVGWVALAIATVKTCVLLLVRLVHTSLYKAGRTGDWEATSNGYIYYDVAKDADNEDEDKKKDVGDTTEEENGGSEDETNNANAAKSRDYDSSTNASTTSGGSSASSDDTSDSDLSGDSSSDWEDLSTSDSENATRYRNTVRRKIAEHIRQTSNIPLLSSKNDRRTISRSPKPEASKSTKRRLSKSPKPVPNRSPRNTKSKSPMTHSSKNLNTKEDTPGYYVDHLRPSTSADSRTWEYTGRKDTLKAQDKSKLKHTNSRIKEMHEAIRSNINVSDSTSNHPKSLQKPTDHIPIPLMHLRRRPTAHADSEPRGSIADRAEESLLSRIKAHLTRTGPGQRKHLLPAALRPHQYKYSRVDTEDSDDEERIPSTNIHTGHSSSRRMQDKSDQWKTGFTPNVNNQNLLTNISSDTMTYEDETSLYKDLRRREPKTIINVNNQRNRDKFKHIDTSATNEALGENENNGITDSRYERNEFYNDKVYSPQSCNGNLGNETSKSKPSISGNSWTSADSQSRNIEWRDSVPHNRPQQYYDNGSETDMSTDTVPVKEVRFDASNKDRHPQATPWPVKQRSATPYPQSSHEVSNEYDLIPTSIRPTVALDKTPISQSSAAQPVSPDTEVAAITSNSSAFNTHNEHNKASNLTKSKTPFKSNPINNPHHQILEKCKGSLQLGESPAADTETCISQSSSKQTISTINVMSQSSAEMKGVKRNVCYKDRNTHNDNKAMSHNIDTILQPQKVNRSPHSYTISPNGKSHIRSCVRRHSSNSSPFLTQTIDTQPVIQEKQKPISLSEAAKYTNMYHLTMSRDARGSPSEGRLSKTPESSFKLTSSPVDTSTPIRPRDALKKDKLPRDVNNTLYDSKHIVGRVPQSVTNSIRKAPVQTQSINDTEHTSGVPEVSQIESLSLSTPKTEDVEGSQDKQSAPRDVTGEQAYHKSRLSTSINHDTIKSQTPTPSLSHIRPVFSPFD